MKKIAALMLVFVILTVGCTNPRKTDIKNTGSENTESENMGTPEAVNVKEITGAVANVVQQVQEYILDEDLDILDELTRELETADGETKTGLALDFASDVSLGQLCMLSNEALLVIAGKALEAYPEHPLILNNFASLLVSTERTQEAIYFYTQALKSEPQHPVILVNLANAWIQQGDFAAAEQYAKKALSVMPDYGAAYQVMTTVHLKNENSELAAETMIKSAKHTFNSLSIHQFKSFLREANLIEGKHDYPLKEEFIDELYDIAKSDMMLVKDNGADTPEEQIKVKDFPPLGDIDDYIASAEYLAAEIKNLYNNYIRSMNKGIEYSKKTEEHISGSRGSGGTIPTVKSLRQYFAVKVLTSFYNHRLKQSQMDYKQKYDDLMGDMTVEKDVTEKNLVGRQKLLEKQIKEIEGEISTTNDPEILSVLSAEAAQLEMESLHLYSDYLNEVEKIDKKYYNDFINVHQEYYNRNRQIIEEYWLKSGGLIKYVFNQSLFDQLNNGREELAYKGLYQALSGLTGASFMFGLDRDLSDKSDEMLGKDKESLEAVDVGWGEQGLNPDVQPLQTFEEPGQLPPIGFKGKLVSVSYDGENLTADFNTDATYYSYTKNLFTGDSSTVSAYGITTKAKINAGPYSIESSYSEKGGIFVEKDGNGNVKNWGEIDIKSVSAGISAAESGITASAKEVTKSSVMTGISEIKRSRELEFKILVGTVTTSF